MADNTINFTDFQATAARLAGGVKPGAPVDQVDAGAIVETVTSKGQDTTYLDNVLRRDVGDGAGMYSAAQVDQVMGDLAATETIRSVYQEQLGREPDGEGLAQWSEVISNLRARGLDDQQVKDELTKRVQASDEYAQKHPAEAPPAPADQPPTTAGQTGPIPDSSLVGTHGGQCVVFVEAQTGTYFPVEAAAQMLNPGMHPGYNVVSTPQPGDIFVSTGGQYGHTGIVKSVNADGSLTVIDSNSNLDEIVSEHAMAASKPAGYLRRDPSQAAQPYGGGG